MRLLLGAVVFAALLLATDAAWAHDSGFGLARYLPDGTPDESFGSRGVVVTRSAERSFVANALTLQPDGKIVIAGMSGDLTSGSTQLALARYNADGTADSSFSGGVVTTPVGIGGGQANAVALQPDGMIVVAGTAFAHGNEDDEFLVARYAQAGQPDAGFGTDGISRAHVGVGASAASALALQPDGRILVVGTAFSNGATDDDFALVRYESTGQLDTTFGSDGVVTTDFGSAAAGASLDRATALALEPDGKIVVAGFTRGAQSAFSIARYNPDGSADSSFGRVGRMQIPTPEPQVSAIVVQASGDIIVAGSSASPQRGTSPFVLVRLHADGQPDERFGDAGLVATSFEGSRSGARAVAAQADGKLVAGGAKAGSPGAQSDAVPDSGFALARYTLDGRVDPSFGRDGRAVTDMGDAGATPLSLAIQPDGKILAAGLVFFQVPTPATPSITDRVSSLAIPVAAIGVALLAVAVAARRRRTRKRAARSA